MSRLAGHNPTRTLVLTASELECLPELVRREIRYIGYRLRVGDNLSSDERTRLEERQINLAGCLGVMVAAIK